MQLAEEYLLNMLGRLDAEVIKATKKIVMNGADKSQNLAERLKNERHIFAQVWAGSQHKKAMQKNIKH